MNFHAIMEVPKGDKHPQLSHIPEIDSFAKSDLDRKLVVPDAILQDCGHAIRRCHRERPRTGWRWLQEGFRRTYQDPEFFKRIQKDDRRRAYTAVTRKRTKRRCEEIPREPEVIEVFKKLVGAGQLPAR